MIFWNVELNAFFSGFLRFWLDFGRPWGVKKFQKIVKNRFRDAFGPRLGFKCDRGGDLGAILGDFGRILGGFWTDFGRILGRFLEGFGWTNND